MFKSFKLFIQGDRPTDERVRQPGGQKLRRRNRNRNPDENRRVVGPNHEAARRNDSDAQKQTSKSVSRSTRTSR
jgi:hypothetical protein